MPTQDAADRAANPLATRDQGILEELAIRLYDSGPVQEAIERGRRTMQADPRAKTESGSSTLEIDLRELAFNACAITATADSDRPKLYWGINMAHTWFGRRVPGSRCGIDNPDSMYRLMAIDDRSSYVIKGRVPPVRPSDVSFTVFPSWPGLIESNGEFPGALGGWTVDDIAVDASGVFELSLDPSPANGRRNHVEIKPGANLIFARDVLSDWALETPLYLSIERISGPPPKAVRSEDELMAVAARNVEQSVRYWLSLPAFYYYRGAANKLFTAANPAFAKGGQFTANGHFELKPGEAYVLTLDPLGTKYLGVQLADLYGASLDYAHHTSSLNQSQMAANADGTLTYVLCLEDPGIYNWLDPTGLDAGLFMFRYQGYNPARVTPERAIRDERVVPISQLDATLPKNTRRVSSEERRRQLDERLASYNRRLRESPPGAL